MADRPEEKLTAEPDFGAKGPVRTLAKAPKLKNVRATLRKLGSYLKPHRKTLVIVLLLTVITTLITITCTRLNGYVVDAFILEGDQRGLLDICIVMAAIYLLGTLSTYLQNVLMVKAAQRTTAEVRRDLFAHVLKLPLSVFDTRSSGDLMSRLTNDVDNINNAMSQNLVQFFNSTITIIGMLTAMLLLSPLLTLICLVTTPVTYIVSRFFLRVAQRFFVVQQRELGAMNGYVEEMVSGQKVVRLFSREEAVQSDFDSINARLVSGSLKAQSVSGIIGPCNNMINNFAYLLVAVAGGVCIIHQYGSITVGIVFSFLLYMRNFTNPINNILTLVNTLQLALASAERVFEIMDEPVEQDAINAAPIKEMRGDIEMLNMDFSYVTGKQVLHDAQITAKAGQTVAIVGPTGAGKTTIINLLTRFYDLDSGEILIDGRNIETITRQSLRRSVALVLQDTFLFSDTIRENIRYGRFTATDEDVKQAARKAHAHEFILQLPLGYDTVLQDNGQNLSQGQRQLLGIARAIITQASILILDEATSSVDTRTEMLIQNALLKLMRGKTSFVIAHRLSTIKNADNILVIEDGHVVEQGSHELLIGKRGCYANLFNSQFMGRGVYEVH